MWPNPQETADLVSDRTNSNRQEREKLLIWLNFELFNGSFSFETVNHVFFWIVPL